MKVSKLEKKKKRLKERIQLLEDQLQAALVQKISMKMEIDISEYTRKILDLRKELSELK